MSLQKIPKNLLFTISNLSENDSNRILRVALALNQSTKLDRSKIVGNIAAECGLSNAKVLDILGVYLGLLKLFLNSTDADFGSRLKQIGFGDDFIERLPLSSNREQIYRTISTKRRVFNTLKGLNWRIDLSLSDQALSEKFPKTVLMQLTFSNDEKVTIEMDLANFHKLRYNVALILKEMNALQSLPILNNK